MKQMALSLLAVFSVTQISCSSGDNDDGRESPRLTNVELSIDRGGGSLTNIRAELTYSGSELNHIQYTRNGDPDGSQEFTYASGKVSKVVHIDAEGDRAEQTFTYKDDLLATTEFVVAGVFTQSTAISYDETAGNRMKSSTQSVQSVGGAPGTPIFTNVKYDDEDRVKLVETIVGNNGSTREYRYNEQNRPDRATNYSQGQFLTEHQVAYNKDSRVEEIDDQENNRATVQYEGGLMQEVRWLAPSQGETRTIRYTYESGSAAGFSFLPHLPFNELFDLSGHGYTTFDDVQLSVDAPSDIPRAAADPDPDPIPDPDPSGTCDAFEQLFAQAPVAACDFCLSNSCCGELGFCASNSSCDALVECLTSCGNDTSCTEQCQSIYSGGVSDLTGVINCLDSQCSVECSG